MITNNLIDRLNAKTAQYRAKKARKGRRRALSSISKCCVVTTDDGRNTREVKFEQPPTIGQLEGCIGPDTWVVSVEMWRAPRRARQRQALAAE